MSRSMNQPRVRALLRAALCGLTLQVAACAGSDLKPLPNYNPDPYKLGGGDQIRIITYGEDQLTGEFRVDDRGKVSIPLLGELEASNLTPSELATQIADKLRAGGILRTPSVSVEMVAYRPISVIGEVSKPGQYPYQPGMTMLTAVAVAGGFTYRAVQGYAADTRTSNAQPPVEGLIKPKSYVAPGDLIQIYERHL